MSVVVRDDDDGLNGVFLRSAAQRRLDGRLEEKQNNEGWGSNPARKEVTKMGSFGCKYEKWDTQLEKMLRKTYSNCEDFDAQLLMDIF